MRNTSPSGTKFRVAYHLVFANIYPVRIQISSQDDSTEKLKEYGLSKRIIPYYRIWVRIQYGMDIPHVTREERNKLSGGGTYKDRTPVMRRVQYS